MLYSKTCLGGMVTAPHHLAAQAGAQILREGGNAVEAMVAAAAAPEAPQHGNPVWEHAWPRVSGAAAAVPGQATNLGLLLGLPGLLSLVPLAAPWLWAAAAFREDATETDAIGTKP